MPSIIRAPDQYASQDFDIIIIGGGIYGVFLALQSTIHGLRPLLLERDDFGGKTSFNSLRIIHGGLRYLQSADLRRFAESVTERRWFLLNFPDLVSPLPCLMPLYGKGVRRNSLMRMALAANNTLSFSRNNGVPRPNHIQAARVINNSDTLDRFPMIRKENLKGGALWHDAALEDSPRIIMELLHWAVDQGASAVNYMQVTELLPHTGQISGVVACDSIDGKEYQFRAPIVVNAAGPWAEQLAAHFGNRQKDIFSPSLAWNLWMDKPAPSCCALALTADRPGAPTYFVRPWKGRMLLGTGHAVWTGSLNNPQPSEGQIQLMLADINAAAPELNLTNRDVRHVFAGLLPARKLGSAELAVRPAIVNHAHNSGFRGLYTVCGVKFTTARKVASDTLIKILGRPGAAPHLRSKRPPPALGWKSTGLDFDNNQVRGRYLADIRRLISDESVQHLTDLVFRRTDLWENPNAVRQLVPDISNSFDWGRERKNSELRNLSQKCGVTFENDYKAVSASRQSNS